MRTPGEIEEACRVFGAMAMAIANECRKTGRVPDTNVEWASMTASVGVLKWVLGEEPYSKTMQDMIDQLKTVTDPKTRSFGRN